MTVNGLQVSGLRLRFEEGRVIEATADTNAEVVRASLAEDAGACRLGEVALVDASSRVGAWASSSRRRCSTRTPPATSPGARPSTTRFPDGLPDDPAALEARGVNESDVHQDVMIGGPEVAVSGLTAAGDEVPVLVAERWEI